MRIYESWGESGRIGNEEENSHNYCEISKCVDFAHVVDINECEVFRHLCINGLCENVFGMFRCICNEGYQLDHSGGNCTGKSHFNAQLI